MGAGSFATVLWWTVWRTLTGHSASDQKEVSPSVTLHDKVCIVTGANVGIGYETALDFAKRGARVIVTCRDDEKGNRTVERIKVASGNQTVEYMQLELGSLKSVRTFAEEFRKKGLPLHILINNAGVMAIPKLTYTEDGFETQMGVNHLGHFLLTNLLLDIIEESAPSTIVNVSSSANYGGKINWNDLHFKEGKYHPFQAYCNSKLANVLFTYELAKRLKGKGVTVNSVHPGAVDTELTRHGSFSMDGIKKRWFKTPYEGALTSIYVAISPEAADATGTFWVNCAPVKSAKLSYDENVQKRFWDLSCEMVGLKTDS